MTLSQEIEEQVKKQIEDFKKTLKPNDIANSLGEYNPKKHRLILSDCDFERLDITDLGVLEMIDGYADFMNSKIINLGNLTTIGGYANFAVSNVIDLGNLTTIGGGANFASSNVENLGNLTTIGGYANFAVSNVIDLGNLTTIGGSAYFDDSKVENLGNLTTIGDSIIANGNKLTRQQVIDYLNKMNEVFFVERNTILYLSEINPDNSKIEKKIIMALQKSGEWDKKPPIDANFLKDEIPLGKINLNLDGTFGVQRKHYW